MIKNKCYICNYEWNAEDGEACPNCNSLDSTNIGDDEIEFEQHNFEDEVAITEIVDKIEQETE